MTVAVFAFFTKPNFRSTDPQWLNRLLVEMATQKEASLIIIYTNRPDCFGLTHPSIELVVEKPRVSWLFTRRRSLGHWRKRALAAGASAALCMGLQSFVASPISTFILLTPGTAARAKGLKLPQNAAGVFVTRPQEQALAAKSGLPVYRIPAAPLMPLQTNVSHGAVQEHYTGYSAYFFYAGPVVDTTAMIFMLKAFSRFKRRQKTSWKLVLLPEGSEGVAPLQQALSSYKYRNDVVLLTAPPTEDEQIALLGAAYAFIQPLPAQPYGRYLAEALGLGLPVLAFDEPANRELAGDAALYFEDADDEALADRLMLLYKDEGLRTRLASSAAKKGAALTWSEVAANLWQVLSVGVK